MVLKDNNKKMKKILIKITFLLFLLIFSCLISSAQKIKFENTVRIGSFTYFFGIVDVNPFYGIDYNLPRTNKTGFSISNASGIVINDKFHFGVEVGYANYLEPISPFGISGLIALSDIRIDFSKKKPFTMFFYFDPGYSHFWNPYAINNSGNGTSSFLLDFGLGARYKVFDTRKALISTGILLMQQNIYIPLNLGFTF